MATSQFGNQDIFTQHSGKFLLWGIVLIILGMIAIGATTMTTLLSVMLVGALLLVGGIVLIIDSFSFWWGKWRVFFLMLISGLLYAACGGFLIGNPVAASVSLTLILGIFYLVVGICRMIYFLSTRFSNWGWGMFSALLSFVLGILILSNWPESGLFIIGLFVGIDLIFVGWSYIMTSFAARSLVK